MFKRYLTAGFLLVMAVYDLVRWEHTHNGWYAFGSILAASIAMPILIEVAREKL